LATKLKSSAIENELNDSEILKERELEIYENTKFEFENEVENI
jgi:hypothetical protein